jgi:hypothetical protein
MAVTPGLNLFDFRFDLCIGKFARLVRGEKVFIAKALVAHLQVQHCEYLLRLGRQLSALVASQQMRAIGR